MYKSFNDLIAKDSQLMQALSRYLPQMMQWIRACLHVLLSLMIDLWQALAPVVEKWLYVLLKNVQSPVQNASFVPTPSEPAS
tara:strand:+ start:3547 stop:3792 length:246 start_codon:yes stop_codon:yes gene_type:complete